MDYLGLDIAKARFDAHLHRREVKWRGQRGWPILFMGWAIAPNTYRFYMTYIV